MSNLLVALKDIIMQSPSLLPPKPPLTPTRRAACTHMTLKRLYGSYKCTHCNKQSSFGWVYRCTQDCDAEILNYQDELEPSLESLLRMIPDDDDHGSAEAKTLPVKHEPEVKLAPWMEKAIVDGHYTPVQVNILRAQRQKVKDCIAEAEYDLKQSRRPSLAESMSNWLTPLPPILTLPESAGSKTDEASDNTSTLQSPFKRTLSRVSVSGSSKRTSFRRSKIIPDCTYKTCQICRPTSRDRAWQCFDHVMDRSNVTPPNFLTDNRPISDPKLVRTIGLPRSSRHAELLEYDSYSDSDADSQYPRYMTPATHRECWTPEELHRIELDHPVTMTVANDQDNKQGISDDASVQDPALYKGFRHSLRRAFRGMLTSTRRSSRWSTRSNLSVTSSQIARPEQEDEGADMGLWWHKNQSIKDRCGTLSSSSHSREVLEHGEKGEVRVEDGIAVTEEGVDLGTADIIMQI